MALAQDFDQASCDEFLHPKRVVQGQEVGPESCLMQETDVEFEGRTWRRLDIGLSDTVEGYLPKTGSYINYFTSAPDLVFPQGGESRSDLLRYRAVRQEQGQQHDPALSARALGLERETVGDRARPGKVFQTR